MALSVPEGRSALPCTGAVTATPASRDSMVTWLPFWPTRTHPVLSRALTSCWPPMAGNSGKFHLGALGRLYAVRAGVNGIGQRNNH